MKSVPSHGIAAVLCTWDCWSISCRGWFHRLLVRACAWGLSQRVFVQLNVIKNINGKRTMQTNYLFQWQFLPWDVRLVVSKFSGKEGNTFCGICILLIKGEQNCILSLSCLSPLFLFSHQVLFVAHFMLICKTKNKWRLWRWSYTFSYFTIC